MERLFLGHIISETSRTIVGFVKDVGSEWNQAIGENRRRIIGLTYLRSQNVFPGSKLETLLEKEAQENSSSNSSKTT